MRQISRPPLNPRPRPRPHRHEREAFGFGHEAAKCGTCSPRAALGRGPSLLGGGADRQPEGVNWIKIVMAETTEKTTEKKLSVAATKTLSLKGRGIEQGVVRQSFSHGRSKAVVVEKVKSRVPTRARAETATPAAAPPKRTLAAPSAVPITPAAPPATATP